MPIWNKLVRDRIPEIIEADGQGAITRTLDDHEFRVELRKKLLEEAEELAVAVGNDIATEVADVLEVLDAICQTNNLDMHDVRRLQALKREERGAFGQRVFLLETRPARPA